MKKTNIFKKKFKSIFCVLFHSTCFKGLHKNLWVCNCCWMPSEQFFKYIMGRIGCISMRWWYLFCSRLILSWIFIVLAHWNNNPWVDMKLETLSWFWAKLETLSWFRAKLETLSWFRAKLETLSWFLVRSQPVLFLLFNAPSLVEEQ